MPTQRLCRACGEWHPLDLSWPEGCFTHFRRTWETKSDLPHPYVISDAINPMQCMADGKIYESKSAMSAAHKAHGLIEVGNEIDATLKMAAQKPERPKVSKAEIGAALAKVKAGYRPQLPND